MPGGLVLFTLVSALERQPEQQGPAADREAGRDLTPPAHRRNDLLPEADTHQRGNPERRDPEREPPISLLGFDAHRSLPPFAQFRELVRKRGAPLKALLLDQSFAAGVGNWIADEVLYQARLDPRRRASSLTDAEIARMRGALQRVIDTSVPGPDLSYQGYQEAQAAANQLSGNRYDGIFRRRWCARCAGHAYRPARH